MKASQWHTDAPTKTWGAIQQELKADVLQGGAWGVFQIKLGRHVFYAHGTGWSWLAILEQGRFGNRLYCPYGPTVTSPGALHESLTALTACARANNVAYIRVEPQGPLAEADLRAARLHPAHRNIHPRFTLIKDLTPPQSDLLAEMSATNRNLYRTAQKKGLSFDSSTNPADIPIFLNMMHAVAVSNKITIHPDSYYQTMAEVLMPLGTMKLYTATLEGAPVASSLVFDNTHTRYYVHAASLAEARKLHPGSPMLSHMIFEAKAQGQTAFDFYGIAPPGQPNHRWAGFTKFKQSFGGEPVDRHGTWELGIKKITYGLYKSLTQLKI